MCANKKKNPFIASQSRLVAKAIWLPKQGPYKPVIALNIALTIFVKIYLDAFCQSIQNLTTN